MSKTARKTSKRPKGSSPPKRAESAGGRNLVVVESPAKARTINRYLGSGYIVKASMGHVRDLPARKMGVDVEDGFAPTYEPLPGRKKVLDQLTKYARSCRQVFLATDLDREGEAIAWHLAESLEIPEKKIRRVIFNEITAPAIRQAFANPHGIDMDKVNAQQARRILDRIVGYEISPLLWKKVARGLSAGRVQSVAVRLIVEREREIDAFMPQEYWRVRAILTCDLPGAPQLARQWAELLRRRNDKGDPPTQQVRGEFLTERGAFTAELVKWKGERFKVDNHAAAVEAAKALGLEVEQVVTKDNPEGKGPARREVTVIGRVDPARANFVVAALKHSTRRSRPPAPFTTASLQQAAAVQLRFSASRTMRIAQQLYEGVDVPGAGREGLITYMRTDSTRISAEALKSVRQFIAETFGPDYVPDKPTHFSSGQRTQDAHEAVRPTDVTRRPEDLAGALNAQQLRLYELIWKRFVACQMPPAIWKVTEADIVAQPDSAGAVLKAAGRTLQFDGFMRVAGLPKNGEQILTQLDSRQKLAAIEIAPTQHFTQPPPRYTEASLVKALEADGIGRPSTYAAIIQTIQDRNYVKLEDRSFRPTDVGIVVTKKLVKHFPKIFDVRFTAHMEDELDKIEDAQIDWQRVLEEFYGPFSDDLKKAGEEMVHAKAESQPSDYKCGECGRAMVYRFSKNGRYLACTGYPDCKTTYPVDKDGKKIELESVDVACPKCGKAMVTRQGRFGMFLSCSTYPDCDGVLNLDKKGFVKHPSAPPLQVELECPKCGKPLNLRRGKRGPWLSCSTWPKCRGRAAWKTLPDETRKQLEAKLIEHERQHPVPEIRTLDGTPIGDEHKPQPLE